MNDGMGNSVEHIILTMKLFINQLEENRYVPSPMRLLRLALKVARRTPAATEGGHTEMELMYLDKQIRV